MLFSFSSVFIGALTLNLRRTSGVAGDPRGTLLVIISKTIWNFFMGFQICLKHLKICHMPKFHKISLISNYVIKAFKERNTPFFFLAFFKSEGGLSDPRNTSCVVSFFSVEEGGISFFKSEGGLSDPRRPARLLRF